MRVQVAGVVTHRQRPQTASGLTFFGLEDEAGLMGVMVSPGLWKHQRILAPAAKALIIRGIVQNVVVGAEAGAAQFPVNALSDRRRSS